MPIKLTKDHFKWTNGRGHTQRPILYSQKKNNYGLGNPVRESVSIKCTDCVGKKEHSSDQWWEKAFDNQLKNLDVSGSVGGEVTLKQNMPITTAIGHKMQRYYIRFVRGGVLEGQVERITGVEGEVSAASGVERRKEKGQGERGSGKRKKRAAKEGKEERRERRKLKRLVEKELELLRGGG